MISISETKDHELLAALNKEVQELHAAMHPEMFKPYNKTEIDKAFRQFLDDDNCKAYIAHRGETPIGYIIFYTRETNENAFRYNVRSLYIDQLCVLQQHRNTGTGKLLLKQAEQFAKEHQLNKIELDHWSSNTVAAAFFRKHGYTLHRECLVKIVDL